MLSLRLLWDNLKERIESVDKSDFNSAWEWPPLISGLTKGFHRSPTLMLDSDDTKTEPLSKVKITRRIILNRLDLKALNKPKYLIVAGLVVCDEISKLLKVLWSTSGPAKDTQGNDVKTASRAPKTREIAPTYRTRLVRRDPTADPPSWTLHLLLAIQMKRSLGLQKPLALEMFHETLLNSSFDMRLVAKYPRYPLCHYGGKAMSPDRPCARTKFCKADRRCFSSSPELEIVLHLILDCLQTTDLPSE